MVKTAISSRNGNFFSEFSTYQVFTEFPFMEEWQMLETASSGSKRTKGQIFSLTLQLGT